MVNDFEVVQKLYCTNLGCPENKLSQKHTSIYTYKLGLNLGTNPTLNIAVFHAYPLLFLIL